MSAKSSAKFQKVNSGAMSWLESLRKKILKDPAEKAGTNAANKLINMHKKKK